MPQGQAGELKLPRFSFVPTSKRPKEQGACATQGEYNGASAQGGTMAPRKTARERELESQMAEMRGQLQAIMAMGSAKQTVISGKPVVGIRNVSSYTVGLSNTIQGEQGDVTLHPAGFKGHDPNTVAVISHQFWMSLRKGRYVAKGLIIRDDSVVGSGATLGPDDVEGDVVDAAHNLVVDPFQWVESRTDDQLREDIAKIDSEPSLRRLAAAVDEIIYRIGEEHYKEHPERAKYAIRDCPSQYRFVDQLVEDRLLELDPLAQDVSDERNTVASFRG